jgi:Cu/Ag efflux pump CusA
MTALTTILGPVPHLTSHGLGSEVQSPLAVVVVLGLLSSTFLAQVLVPGGISGLRQGSCLSLKGEIFLTSKLEREEHE